MQPSPDVLFLRKRVSHSFYDSRLSIVSKIATQLVIIVWREETLSCSGIRQPCTGCDRT